MLSLKSPEYTIKRRRGGQPGNQNARGNRGNPYPRRNLSSRRGGAPIGNQNARKTRTLLSELTHDYAKSPEAQEWIRNNSKALDSIAIQGQEQRDPALFDWSQGFTLDSIAEKGAELKLGACIEPDFTG